MAWYTVDQRLLTIKIFYFLTLSGEFWQFYDILNHPLLPRYEQIVDLNSLKVGEMGKLEGNLWNSS